MTDLLPCPFCEAALVWSHTYSEYHHPIAKCILSGHKFKKGMIGQWNRRALPAVQPVTVSGHWKDHCRTNNGSDICDEPCRKCLAKPPFSHFAVQPAAPHVNETAKSEHDVAVMLTPATKGGDA